MLKYKYMKFQDISNFVDVEFISSNVYIEEGAKIASGCTIYPNVYISKNVTIGENTKIFQGASITDNSKIGPNCTIGNYSLIRTNTILKGNNTIGPFTEIKSSTFEEGSSVFHHSFIGDAQIGKKVMIGAGVITANSKHTNEKFKTIIKDNVKIGIHVGLVAPITIAENTFIAAGSTVTKSNKGNELIIARAREVYKEWKGE